MPRPVKQTADPVGMGASFEDNSGRLLGREPPPERAWVGGHGGFFHYLSLRVKHAAVRFAVPEIYSHGQFALKPVCGRVIHDQPPSIWATSPSLDWGPYRYPGRLAFSSHLMVLTPEATPRPARLADALATAGLGRSCGGEIRLLRVLLASQVCS